MRVKHQITGKVKQIKKVNIIPAHEILVLAAYAEKPPSNTHAYISSGAKGLNFGLSLHLHPYFVYASSKSSSESAHFVQAHLSLCCSIM